MSMDRCDHCERPIDTDEDLDCYVAEDMCICQICRDKSELLAERMQEEYEAQQAQVNDEERI